MDPNQFRLSDLAVVLGAFAVSSLAGVAQLLRSHEELNVRVVLAALLYSGVIGMGIGLMLSAYVQDVRIVLGVSALAGAGGASVLDFIWVCLQLFFQGKLSVTVRTSQDQDSINVDGDKR